MARLASLLIAGVLAGAPLPAQTVTIRIGALQTECYPACDHSTEWLQQLYAEVRDTSGVLLDPTGIYFEWAVDFCRGFGLQYGYTSGNGLFHIAVDGNLRKVTPDCCPPCAFQAYDVGVRAQVNDTLLVAAPVRVPNIRIPAAHGLRANFPNPFNAGTTVPFDVAEGARVRLEIFDLSGRMIVRLTDRMFDAGEHQLTWNPGDTPSGTYLAQLTVTPSRGTPSVFARRLVLVR